VHVLTEEISTVMTDVLFLDLLTNLSFITCNDFGQEIWVLLNLLKITTYVKSNYLFFINQQMRNKLATDV